jgi:C4-dicarboxylate-specific signal transduction histidine kinase
MFESREARYWPRGGQYCLLDTPDARVRLAATTTMASTLAHEVTQPLTAAANYLYACARRLRSRGEGEEELLMMIEHANRETQKAAEIIRRMRSFIVTGRIAGRRENLRTMVERVAAGMMIPGSSQIEIVRDIELAYFVTADRVQIEQVLSNLLRNACEALEGQARRRIAITARREGRDVVVRIEDNGPGLEPEILERLFEPQFTTKASGLGLGLAICKTIVEAHGGRIWAENAKGGGAAFSVALPADDGGAQDAREQRG